MYYSSKILEPQPVLVLVLGVRGKGQGWWLAFESQEWSEHTVTLLIRNDLIILRSKLCLDLYLFVVLLVCFHGTMAACVCLCISPVTTDLPYIANELVRQVPI